MRPTVRTIQCRGKTVKCSPLVVILMHELSQITCHLLTAQCKYYSTEMVSGENNTIVG